MNIVFFIGQLGHGGAENVVATLTSQLAKKGHKITLVSHLRNQFYQVSDEVNLIDVQSWEYDTYVGSFPARLYKKAANRFKDLRNIRRITKEEKPDVVISFLQAWLWQLIIVCKGRYPLICAERNAMIRPVHKNFLIKQVFYRMAYAVQVMSRHDKAWLRGRYKRIYPMPNPLRFEPLNKETYDLLFPERKNILACGRVNTQKGFDKLINSFAKIASSFPEWNVDICGEIENEVYYQQLLDIVKKWNLQGRVTFWGPRSDVDSVMQTHSVFCLSSQNEGFPNVLSEAMANGLACVSFDIVTGPSEIINDGLDGIIVDDQNEDALAGGLAMVLKDNELRYSLGSHAIENIKRFERGRIVDKWESFFSLIVNEYNKK